MILLSTNGKDWEAVAVGDPRHELNIREIVWLGDRYMALGYAWGEDDDESHSVALTSPDGQSWTEAELPPILREFTHSLFISSIGDRALLFVDTYDEGFKALLVQPERP